MAKVLQSGAGALFATRKRWSFPDVLTSCGSSVEPLPRPASSGNLQRLAFQNSDLKHDGKNGHEMSTNRKDRRRHRSAEDGKKNPKVTFLNQLKIDNICLRSHSNDSGVSLVVKKTVTKTQQEKEDVGQLSKISKKENVEADDQSCHQPQEKNLKRMLPAEISKIDVHCSKRLKIDMDHPWLTDCDEDNLSPILENWQQLQPPASITFFGEKVIGHFGGVIDIPGTKIALVVPPGALIEGQTEKLKISTTYTAGLKRPLEGKTPKLTPVVRLQPHGLKFVVPVQLILPHCGDIGDVKGCEFRVFFSQHIEGNGADWIEDEEIGSQGLTSWLTIDTCYVFIPHFTYVNIVIAGKSVRGIYLRVFVMAYKVDENDDQLKVSLWVCENENSTYEQILQSQRKLGKCLIESYVSYTMLDTGRDFFVKARTDKYEKRSWKLLSNPVTKIGFRQLWLENGRANVMLHFQEMKKGTKLNHTISVWQNDNTDVVKFCLDASVRSVRKLQRCNEKTQVILQQATHGSRPTTDHLPFCSQMTPSSMPMPAQVPGCNSCFNPPMVPPAVPPMVSMPVSHLPMGPGSGQPLNQQVMSAHMSHISSNFQAMSSVGSGQVSSNEQRYEQYFNQELVMDFSALSVTDTALLNPSSVNSLPKHAIGFRLCMKLAILLDPLDPVGNDWRALADCFKFDLNVIRFLASKHESQTLIVLLMACRDGLIKKPNDLISYLEEIVRNDAVQVVKTHLNDILNGSKMSLAGGDMVQSVAWRRRHSSQQRSFMSSISTNSSLEGESMSISPVSPIDNIFIPSNVQRSPSVQNDDLQGENNQNSSYLTGKQPERKNISFSSSDVNENALNDFSMGEENDLLETCEQNLLNIHL